MDIADRSAGRNGAVGTTTGHVLESLPRSFVVLDDLQPPGSHASIEHLVIGPTGAFAVESERYRDGIVEQAAAMTDVLGASVGSVVVQHGSSSSPVRGGARHCSPSQLVELLSDGDAVLEAHDVVSLALRATDRCVRQGRAAAVPVA